MTVHSQPLLPKLVSLDYSLARERERERERSWQAALSQSLLHYVSVPNNTALLHTAHLLLAALDRLQLHISPAAHLPAWHSLQTRTAPATISTHKYHRITFIMYFRAVLMLTIISRKHINELCFLFCFSVSATGWASQGNFSLDPALMIWDDRTPEKRWCQPSRGPQMMPALSQHTKLPKFNHSIYIAVRIHVIN